MPKRSVTGDAGLAVGDRVRAETFLGFEDDVGCAHGEHLHFERHKKRSDPDPFDLRDDCRLPERRRLVGTTGEAGARGAQDGDRGAELRGELEHAPGGPVELEEEMLPVHLPVEYDVVVPQLGRGG